MVLPEQIPNADIESVICSLKSIISARVLTGNTGQIEEVHVLAESSRPPKQVVRDIESALQARFGLELDHKKVSVAQTHNGSNFKFSENRLKFSDVSISLNGVKAEAVVRLRQNGNTLSGTATGHSSSHNQLRLIATATLRAVENCSESDGTLVLEDLTPSVTLSGKNIVVVFISMITQRGEDFLAGSAVVKQDLWKAVVNATLDAINRRLGSIGEE